jgi:hypothetical protein
MGGGRPVGGKLGANWMSVVLVVSVVLVGLAARKKPKKKKPQEQDKVVQAKRHTTPKRGRRGVKCG